MHHQVWWFIKRDPVTIVSPLQHRIPVSPFTVTYQKYFP